MLDSVDEPLDQVPLLVFPAIIASLEGATLGRGNDDLGIARPHQVDERVGVIGFVGNHGSWCVIAQQFRSPDYVGLLPRTEPEFNRNSLGIAGKMQLGAEAPTRTAERFVLFFSVPPAAC